MNNKLSVEDLEDLAQGAAFLGTGGGGDPYIGMLLARHAIEEFGMPEIIEPEDLDDDATVFTSTMLGAPTVLVEKAASGDDIDLSINKLAQFIGKKPDAISPIEIGGMNSMIPICAAARMGLPLVNSDGMGRAFPEIQMVTYNVYGVPTTPAVIVDEHLESVIVETSEAKRAEDLIRVCAIQMGLSVMISCYPLTGKQVKNYGVSGTIGIALGIGRALVEGRKRGEPVQAMMDLLRSTKYYNHCVELFDGKVTDLRRETTRGFSIGHCHIEAIDGSGDLLQLEFQNEHLVARLNGNTVAIVPDLISVVDRETGQTITTEGLAYGQRVKVIGTSAAPVMRTPESLAVFGPHAFGIEEEFLRIEEIHNLV
ncbi:MAG: DUF917 family protein [Gammaproteobacteria bacterium]|nr:DUF917 family protein [Gammaproteobacteria bacterium]